MKHEKELQAIGQQMLSAREAIGLSRWAIEKQSGGKIKLGTIKTIEEAETSYSINSLLTLAKELGVKEIKWGKATIKA